MKAFCLLDVNVLVALSWAEHLHHASAWQWFGAQHARAWATCPFTECGLVRVLSNLKRLAGAASVEQAVCSLKVMQAYPRHRFLAADFSPAEDPQFARLQGYRQVTDAYLLILARRNGGALATFDGGIQSMARELYGDEDSVELIAAG